MFGLLGAAAVLPAQAAAVNPAQLGREYKKAKAYYLELSRRDPGVRNLAEWERAASQLLNFLNEHEGTEYAPSAKFLLGLPFTDYYADGEVPEEAKQPFVGAYFFQEVKVFLLILGGMVLIAVILAVLQMVGKN